MSDIDGSATDFWTPERFGRAKDAAQSLAPASVDKLRDQLKRLNEGSNEKEIDKFRMQVGVILIALMEKDCPPFFSGIVESHGHAAFSRSDRKFFDVLWLKGIDQYDLALKYCDDGRKAGQILNLLHCDDFRSLGCLKIIRSSLESLRRKAIKQIEIDAFDILKSSTLKMSDEKKKGIALDAARRICACRLALASGKERRWARGAELHFWMFQTRPDASNLRRSLTEFEGRISVFSDRDSVSEMGVLVDPSLGQ